MSGSNNNISPLLFAARPNPAMYDRGKLATQVELTLFDDGKCHRRHAGQLKQVDGKALVADLNTLSGLIIDATEYCACYAVGDDARRSESINKEPVFRQYLYLFSILIAFEWQPSARTMQRLQIAAQKASDFLYDVTDGYMAIGQVILGGRELLDVADIQVMASNRFHPRSWISALHEQHKFQPIRLGRGLWRKDQGFVVSWDESDSHRVLVHEWGHYALELVDEYLDLVKLQRSRRAQRQWREPAERDPLLDAPRPISLANQQKPNSLFIAAPSIALPVDSIMSTLASSELIPRHDPPSDPRQKADPRWINMLTRIKNHFPLVAPDWKAGTAPPARLEGPAELPLPDLPVFRQQSSGAPIEEIQLSSRNMSDLHDLLIPPTNQSGKKNTAEKMPGSSWAYVLKSGAQAERESGRIVGQGVLGEREMSQGLELLGAAIGDYVVVVAQTIDTEAHTSQLKVIRGEIKGVERNNQPIVSWQSVTPKQPPDFIDVLPAEIRSVTEGGLPQLPTKLRVQIEARELPAEVYLCALGQLPTPVAYDSERPAVDVAYPDAPRKRWISAIVESNHLDGHILLRWADESIYICGYSHGGGPCTGGGGRCVCYTAGSYEGNSMLFYRDNVDGSDTQSQRVDAPRLDDEGARIVSTVMQGGLHYLAPAAGAPEARSYIFSMSSNQPLNTHSATLVLYYDDAARQIDGDLLIYRWGQNNTWQRLTTYAPATQSYVCIPLDQATPETCDSTNGNRVEFFDRYRIYWTPR